MKPFFSIVVPTLNEEDTITSLLKDLSKQTFKDFELIIVDGKSEDKTVSQIKKYQNKLLNIKVIESEKRNLCYQKNEGAKQASGDYLIFLDADIQLDKKYLKKIHQAIKEKGVQFLTTYQLPDKENSLDEFLVDIANITLELLSVINKQMAPGYNLIVKKDIFEEVGGFDEEAVFSEDHELSIRIWKMRKIKIHILPEHLLRWSFRRLRKDGRLPIIYKYSLATIHMLLLGKITDENFRYPMGGNYFRKLDKLKNKTFLNKFKREIKKIAGFTLP